MPATNGASELKSVTLGHAPPLQDIAITISTNDDCKMHILLNALTIM